MEFSKLGIAFVSDEVPDSHKIQELIDQKENELIQEAGEHLDRWLDGLGLERVMGVVVPKGKIR